MPLHETNRDDGCRKKYRSGRDIAVAVGLAATALERVRVGEKRVRLIMSSTKLRPCAMFPLPLLPISLMAAIKLFRPPG